MAKESGLGDQLFVVGYDISGDVGSVDRIGAPSGVLDVTPINASGHERIHSHIDGEITFQHFFNDADAAEHEALKAKGSGGDRVVSYFHGSGIGEMAAAMLAKQVNYDFTRGADGSLEGPSQCLANAKGLDYCDQLTDGQRTDTEATDGDSLDGGAASSAGLAAYLHVFDFDGTDVTLKVQESSDDGATDAFANVTGGAFTQVTAAPTAERIVTSLSQAVEQYLRVVSSTSGGFNSVTFAVCATRAPYA